MLQSADNGSVCSSTVAHIFIRNVCTKRYSTDGRTNEQTKERMILEEKKKEKEGKNAAQAAATAAVGLEVKLKR